MSHGEWRGHLASFTKIGRGFTRLRTVPVGLRQLDVRTMWTRPKKTSLFDQCGQCWNMSDVLIKK